MRDGPGRGIVLAMTSFLRHAALVLLAAALLAPGAGAAMRFHADVTATAKEQWTYKQHGYRQACPGWTYAKGKVAAAAHATGPLIVARSGGVTVGGLSMDATQTLETGRDIDWRIHSRGTQPPCVPCGPDSEYGTCGPPPPHDEADSSGCHPEAKAMAGLVNLTFTLQGTLIVQAATPVTAILRECTYTQLMPREVPLGSPGFLFKAIKFAGAGRRLANLAPGRSVPFRKSWRAGSGCPATRAEMQACTTYTIDMKVTRSKS